MLAKVEGKPKGPQLGNFQHCVFFPIFLERKPPPPVFSKNDEFCEHRFFRHYATYRSMKKFSKKPFKIFSKKIFSKPFCCNFWFPEDFCEKNSFPSLEGALVLFDPAQLMSFLMIVKKPMFFGLCASYLTKQISFGQEVPLILITDFGSKKVVWPVESSVSALRLRKIEFFI